MTVLSISQAQTLEQVLSLGRAQTPLRDVDAQRNLLGARRVASRAPPAILPERRHPPLAPRVADHPHGDVSEELDGHLADAAHGRRSAIARPTPVVRAQPRHGGD